MAWTVSIGKEKRDDGTLVVLLNYTDGSRSVTDYVDAQSGIDDNALAVKAKARISWLDAQDSAFDSISTGTITPKDPDPVIVPDPTPEDVARSQFLSDYRNLTQAQKAISLGLLDAQDKSYQDILNKVKSEFILDYLAFI
jgi:hypothetical protein